MAGVILETTLAVGGESITPLPVADGAIGLAAGVGIYNKLLNPLENTLSTVSWALVATADAIDGNYTITTNASGFTDIELGADTTFSTMSIAIGNTPATPDAVTDFLANAVTVYYDAIRLQGEEPVWGLYNLNVRVSDGWPIDYFLEKKEPATPAESHPTPK